MSAFQRKGRNHIWQELVFRWSRSLECEWVLQPGKCKHLSLVNKTSISSESASAIPIHILVFPKILSCFSVTLTLDSVSQNYLWNWNLLVFIVVVDWSFDFWLFKTISSPRLLICNACQESWFSAILFLFVMAESLRLVCENLWFGFHLVFPLRVGCLAQLSVVERPLSASEFLTQRPLSDCQVPSSCTGCGKNFGKVNLTQPRCWDGEVVVQEEEVSCYRAEIKCQWNSAQLLLQLHSHNLQLCRSNKNYNCSTSVTLNVGLGDATLKFYQ